MRKHKKTNLTKLLQPIVSAACVWALLLGLILPVAATETVSTEADGIITATEAQQEILSETESSELPIESELLLYLRSEVALYIETYGLTPDMPDQVLGDIYTALDGEEAYAAWNKLNELLAEAQKLSAAEMDALLAEINTILCQRFYNVIVQINTPAFAEDHTYTPVAGISVVSTVDDTNTTISYSETEGSITATTKAVEGKNACNQTVYNAQTVKITVTNTSDATSYLGFHWEVVACDHGATVKVAGNKATAASGDFELDTPLESGKSIEVSIQSCNNSAMDISTLKLSGFWIEAATDASVTFEYDSSLGSISVGGTALESGKSYDVPADGVSIAATPKENAIFLGWFNDDTDQRISPDASTTLISLKPITVRAVFITKSDSAWFLVNDTYLFNDLHSAVGMDGAEKVALMNSATLPADDYTIPAGVTLLIPFDEDNTSYTTKPGILEKFATPTEFRRLTMADGAHIVVNGSICVSGKHTTQQGYNSSPSGPQGFLEMQQGSSITVESGGNLYAWGYIVGKNRASASAAASEGTITVKSGGNVYECFQVTDWRGGTDTIAMIDNDYDVFPISQYYIQNVQVPMTLNSGAKGICCMAVVASKITRQPTVPFFGENSLFNTDGALTKDYDETTDRIVLTTTGNVSLSPITITIEGFIGIGDQTLISQNYILPLNGNFTVRATSGSITLNQDFAVLPGVEVYVGSGVNVSFSGAYRLFIYDHDNWARFISPSNVYLRAVPYAYNRLKTRTLNDLKDAKFEINGTVDLSKGAVYTTEAGGNICSTGGGQIKTKAGTQTETHQFLQNIDADGSDVYYSIPITPAKLKNADGSFVQSDTNTYNYVNGQWQTGNCSHTWDAGTAFAATCTLPARTEYTCSSCQTVKCVYNGSANGHTWGEPVNDGKQSCSSYGLETYTCTVCGANNYVKLPTHTYSNPVFTWNSQTAPTKCTVTLTCSAGDSCSNIDPEKGTKVATISGTDSDLEKEIIPGDCKNKGKTIYKAAIRPAVLDPLIPSDTVQIYTDTLEVVGTLGDHKYSDWSLKTPATLTSAAIEARVCSVCKNEETRSVNSAAIDATEYATLSAALEKEPESVTLLHDISGECTISQPVTIELGEHVADIRAGAGYSCFKEGSTVRIVAVEEQELSIAATNIKAGDSLDLFFYVPKADLDGTNYKAVINRTKGGKMEDSQEIPYSEWTDYDSTYMRFSYNGIAAKEMTDPVTVTICRADGTPVSYACTETIRGYALRVLSRTDNAELQTALVDMLNYGAAAQDHFNDYNISNLANTGAEEYLQYATKDDVVCTEESKENNKNLQAASVVAESKLIYTFYFTDITQSMNATATYIDFYGNEVEKNIEGNKFHANEFTDNEGNIIPVMGVDVEGLAIADGRQQITCVVMNGDTVAAQAIGSVQGYVATVKRIAENKNTTPDAVFLMLMKFVDSARAYFS